MVCIFAELLVSGKVNEKPTVVKSAGHGAKIPARRNRRAVQTFDNSIVSALQPGDRKPNVSRRPPSNILYAFPNFDKCDSLLYFPTTFARHLNTGDMNALTKLFSTHVDRKCNVALFHCFTKFVTPKYLLKTYEVMNDLQPDRIMCVHNTKVVENQITATLHMKFTDSKAIFDAVAGSIPDLQQAHLISRDRKENLIHKLTRFERQDDLQKHYLALAELDVDVVVYFRMTMNITFDDVTKKITGMGFAGRLTSMQVANEPTLDLPSAQ